MSKRFKKPSIPRPVLSPSPATSKIHAQLKNAVALHQRGQLIEAEQIYRNILKVAPRDFDATHLLGVVLLQRRQLLEGEQLIARALKINANDPSALNNRGNALRELMRIEDALANYDKAIALKPGYAEAFYNRGNALRDFMRIEDALASYDKAIALKPDYAEAFYNRGIALGALKRFDEALVSYDKAIALKPDYSEAFSNRGVTLQELKRFDEAMASYDKAIALKPDYAEALNNRGVALQKLKRFDEALASYDKAIALKPDYADAFNNRGNALRDFMRLEDALASYDKAIALKPNYAEAFNNQGVVLQQLKRFDEALASCEKAIALKPDYADAFNNRGVALGTLKRFDEALASCDKAIALKPDYADAFNNQGFVLQQLKRFDEALKSYEKALAIKPDHKYAFSGLADCALRICDWTRTAKLADEVKAHVAKRKSAVSPFMLLGYSSDAALQLKCAQGFIADKISTPPRPLWNQTIWRQHKVRIAYLSADFHRHATAYLMAELFELHDRSRIEVLGISFGPDDKSDLRSRLIKSFDQFHDVRFKSDREVAKLLNELQVDIAVDLKGYTENSRPGILAHRPAPIQVNYLGYPGTMGAEFVDYVIADKIVLPFDQQPYYTERIVHLPDCYQVNDSQRKIAGNRPTRHEAGLPERGFVFCCFNNNYKITASVFEVWMRLLQAIDGSVLWLLRDNNSAETNLRKEAAARGIDPARLVFASRMQLEDHLIRHRLADLFLDTLPINAHTTASDALWAGLPLLTCCGESFAGRVAASLLNAVGLPELVASDLEDYQALALKLARDASWLASIKVKLTHNRDTYPLFNSKRFTRHLEAAYTRMWELWQRGESPQSFSVAPNPDTENEMAGVFPGEARLPPIPSRIPSALPVTSNIKADLQNALALHQRDQLIEAEQIYRDILKVAPSDFDTNHLLGVLLLQRRRLVEGEQLIARALKINPNDPGALNNRGNALRDLLRIEDALASYDKAIALKPDYADAFYNRGNTLRDLMRIEDALASYDKAIALKPDYADAFYNRGIALQELKRFDEALLSYDKAIALKPDYANAYNNRGVALQDLKRLDEALASYDKAIALKPDYPDAFNNRGVALQELKRFDEALASYDKAIALKPDYADAFNNRGNALRGLMRIEDALVSYDKSIALKPDYANAINNRGVVLQELKRFDEALNSFEKALAIKPDHKYAFSGLADCTLRICDWTRTAQLADEVKAHVAKRKSIVSPFTLLAYSSDAALQLKCAQSFIADKISILPQSLWNGTRWRHHKVRIAYLSADFHRHATAYLIGELFELHDRSRVEVLGISLGPDDKSDMRSRLIKSFDQFHDVRFRSDREVAKLLNELQVDIAVDLKGYTQNSRPGILAHRPAPIQVNYLGYPGTMGAEFIDYVIADKIVLPFDQQPYYTERIVHLPDCYQVNDSQRKIAGDRPTRQGSGLPEDGFVFCCFNNNYKITAPVFEIWMRLLRAVDGSVLWLLRDNDSAETNLRKEAAARGIDPTRLVFASRMPLEDHLLRHRLADLFLDTLPYSAHTTASDALWAGLPLLTCYGETFAGRVAASLLNAVGLPELVASDLEDYQALALKLARDASLLASIKGKLTRNRDTYPLFNSNRFTRHLEAAYTTMWELWQRGESPQSFSVPPKIPRDEQERTSLERKSANE